MLTVIYGLSGALVFGSGDFLGGMAAKRMGSLLATGIAAVVGFFVLLLASLTFIPGVMSDEAMLWGIVSGVCGALAIMLLYAALAIGPMSILSPLGALVSAVVPVAVGLIIGGEVLAPLGYIALAVGACAIVLVGFIPEKNAVRPTLRGLSFSIASGVFIGLFMIFIDKVPEDSGVIPLVFNRITSASIMFVAIAGMTLLRWAHQRGLFGKDGQPRADIAVGENGNRDLRIGILIAIACGVVDVIGNTLLLFGIHEGNLSVMAVLTAMYPAGTVILAAIILKERIAKLQLLGMILAITAAAMLALS